MGLSDRIKPVKEIAPNWTTLMAPASGQILKVDLPPRHGKSRSIALEIEKVSRSYRIRARDYSRTQPVVARSLDIKCPTDITSKDDAVEWLKKYPEKFILFQGVVEEMEEGYWMGELNIDHASRKKVNRTYPYGTLGHCLRWHMGQKFLGSKNQKSKHGKDAFKLLAMVDKHGEAFGHMDVQDLNAGVARSMHEAWLREDLAYSTLRGVFSLLSKSLSDAENYPEETGVKRGQYWGSVDKEGRGNPLNTERKFIDKIIADIKLRSGTKPDPFTPEECAALTKAFKNISILKPYFPLFALCLSTGSRPNEIRALRWSHVMGLWDQCRVANEFTKPAKEFILTGRPVFIEFAVDEEERQNVNPTQRFKQVKNGTEHQPELNRFVPGHPNLFEEAIKRCLPSRLECMHTKDWRNRLVYQGPKAGDDYLLPYDWHNFRKYFVMACAYAGVPYRRPYNLRHTYVSLMVHKGEYSLRQVSSWIGDTENTTQGRYLGVLTFPTIDKVEGVLTPDEMLKNMSDAEKMAWMQKIMSSLQGT